MSELTKSRLIEIGYRVMVLVLLIFWVAAP
jgi:hypothetical protein